MKRRLREEQTKKLKGEPGNYGKRLMELRPLFSRKCPGSRLIMVFEFMKGYDEDTHNDLLPSKRYKHREMDWYCKNSNKNV